MSNVLTLSLAVRNARATDLNTRLAGGSLAIYSGSQPASPDDGIGAATLLATLTLASPAGSVAIGVLTCTLPPSATIVANGTAAWARFRQSDATAVADGSVGATGSGAAVELANVALVAGYALTPTAISITEG